MVLRDPGLRPRKDAAPRPVQHRAMSDAIPSLDELPISGILERWPQTLAVFLRRRMACPGCAMAPLMTLAEVSACYRAPMDELRTELCRAIGGDG